MMVPIKNVDIAVMYNFFELNLLINQALIGIIMPFTSRNPVVSHCTLEAEISNSFINVGKAVVKSVWFKIVQNVPISKTPTSNDRL